MEKRQPLVDAVKRFRADVAHTRDDIEVRW